MRYVILFSVLAVILVVAFIVLLAVGLAELNRSYIERSTEYVCVDSWGLRVVHYDYQISRSQEDKFYLMTADEFADHCEKDGES